MKCIVCRYRHMPRWHEFRETSRAGCRCFISHLGTVGRERLFWIPSNICAKCESRSSVTGSWVEQDQYRREAKRRHTPHSSDSRGDGDYLFLCRAHDDFQSLCRDSHAIAGWGIRKWQSWARWRSYVWKKFADGPADDQACNLVRSGVKG